MSAFGIGANVRFPPFAEFRGSPDGLWFGMDRRFRISALLVAVAAVAVDQASKGWAVTALRRMGGRLALPGPVDLTFNVNQSNAFGMTPVVGHATRWFLISANLVVAGVLLYVILAKELRPLTRFGLALIMAGGLGNALDRLWFGAVVDFIDASKIGFVWIFNVADATVDTGIGLLALSILLSARETAGEAPRTALDE
jgi:signal peptidase II